MNTALIGLVLTGLLAGCSDGYEMKDPDLGYDMPAPGTGSESEQTDTPVDSGQVTEDIYRVGDIYWQDADEEVSWAYMHEYCENLSLGGYTDWRLPTLAEYRELYPVKEELAFAWSDENYIFWTGDEFVANGEERISMFNMANGLSPTYYVDRIDPEFPWGIRCVREAE
ncbi:MAG: DUF1566 domain-containing protein [Sulfurovum sp.]|nr:DUF1566 domain-containing protein [Sulfurovum sp.]